ncbi:MAG: molybdopterin-binding/glycosyltransferase family 2 protein [Alphaproteobacteria bacterium]
MKFGVMSIAEAEGAILAHSVRSGKTAFKKGRVLTRADIDHLREAGIGEVLAARLEPGDVHEDEAARRIAAALSGPSALPAAPFTGRVNLAANTHGLVLIDRAKIDAVNQIDEAITVATLTPFTRVAPKDLLATIKIIPFAAPERAIDRIETLLAGANTAAVRVAPFKPMRVAYVTSDKLSDKTVRITQERLSRLSSSFAGAPIAASEHAEAPIMSALKEALARNVDLILIQGRSATVDRRDVVPSAIAAAGGVITHFGMPVDPGNLLAIGSIGKAQAIILPGCARSSKENGFDWVLERLAAGLEISPQDIQAMGVGGLLKETARGQPRLAGAQPAKPRFAGILLAAGLSRRMGRNKLLEMFHGKPLVRHAAEALAAAPLARRIVVVGHDASQVEAAIAGLPVEFVGAPNYAEGMSQSLRTGLQALDGDADAVLVMLGDMPALSVSHIERLLAAYDPEEGRTICVPVFNGRRGNPVLFGSEYFKDLMAIEGDMGGRAIIESNRDAVAEVPMPDDAVLKDVDTPEALKALE